MCSSDLGPRPAGPARAASPTVASGPADDTLSNRAVINVDHAEAVAEADFHMAYGLYDQAAEIVQKALEAAPHRRDLKLKLLEVFFVWGNKDSFLEAAQDLRNEIGEGADADWDKVKIAPAPIDDKTYGNPGFGGMMYTAGSNAVKSYFTNLRIFGAQVRKVLLDNAAKKWGVPVEEIGRAHV